MDIAALMRQVPKAAKGMRYNNYNLKRASLELEGGFIMEVRNAQLMEITGKDKSYVIYQIVGEANEG